MKPLLRRIWRQQFPAIAFGLIAIVIVLRVYFFFASLDFIPNSDRGEARILLAVIDGLAIALLLTCLYFVYISISRREQLTKRALERQRELVQYLEAIPEGVAVLNTDRQVVFLNGTGQRLLNTTAEQVPLSLTDLVGKIRLRRSHNLHLPDSDDLPLALALGGTEVSANDLFIETGDGEHNLASHARPLYDNDNTIIGSISIFRDITDATRKEKELQQARTIAEQSLREREIFLANISHEIRTPLNAILGFADLLEPSLPSKESRTYLEGIQVSGQNLLALIDDLLDISTIESGQLQLDSAPVSIPEIVARVSDSMTPLAREKGLRFESEIDPAVPGQVIADPLRLSQILMNVCGNAVKFSPRGLVRLSVLPGEKEEDGRISILFKVTDSGLGIAPDQLDRIFDRFNQLSEDTLFRSGGTGLGLNIAWHLVKSMNGTIQVSSEVGKGTIFSVLLPFTRPDPSLQPVAAIPAKSETKADGHPLRILMAEDNVLNQKVMVGFLQRYRLQPTVVNNGLEAVNTLRSEAFDLIFMDIQMPEMDGYTATRQIRRELGLQTPIIAMTAYTMAGERERCLEVGMNDYLAKPIRMQQLDKVMAHYAPNLSIAPRSDQPTAPPPDQIVQVDYLKEITGGDFELLTDLIQSFKEELPEYRRSMFEAIEQKDRKEFNRLAHKFRSSLTSLALLKTAEKIKALEADSTLTEVALADQLAGLFREIQTGVLFLADIRPEHLA